MKSKTLLQHLAEEHESTKVSYNSYNPGWSDQTSISIYANDDSLTVRFKKIPTEIKIDTEGMGLFDNFVKAKESIIPKLFELKKKNPKKAEEIQAKLYDAMKPSDEKQELEKILTEELQEILEHLETMLKARLIAYVHDHKQQSEKDIAAFVRAVDREISDELSK